jgi:hypothetical protein
VFHSKVSYRCFYVSQTAADVALPDKPELSLNKRDILQGEDGMPVKEVFVLPYPQ